MASFKRKVIRNELRAMIADDIANGKIEKNGKSVNAILGEEWRKLGTPEARYAISVHHTRGIARITSAQKRAYLRYLKKQKKDARKHLKAIRKEKKNNEN